MQTPCYGMSHVFFPPIPWPKNVGRRPNPDTLRSYNEARSICETCDFTSECLELAIDRGETNGCWAGIVFERTVEVKRNISPRDFNRWKENRYKRAGIGKLV